MELDLPNEPKYLLYSTQSLKQRREKLPPDSFQHYLYSAVIQISEGQIIPNAEENNNNNNQNNMNSMCKCLEESGKKEGIPEYLKVIKNLKALRLDDEIRFQNGIVELFSTMYRLDFLLICEIIEACKEQALVDTQKFNNSLVMIGEPGSGKSTLIRYLYGEKLLKLRKSGMVHFAALNPDEKLKDCKTEVARIGTNDLDSYLIEFDGKTIALVDTPSYESFYYASESLARYISTIKYMNHLKNVKLCVLISGDHFSCRGAPLYKFLRRVYQMIGEDQLEKNKKAIIYLSNKTSPECLKNLEHLKYEEPEFRKALDHIVSDSKKFGTNIIYSPEGRENLLDYLKTDDFYIPGSTFKAYLPEEFKTFMEAQLEWHVAHILNALNNNRHDIADMEIALLEKMDGLINAEEIKIALNKIKKPTSPTKV